MCFGAVVQGPLLPLAASLPTLASSLLNVTEKGSLAWSLVLPFLRDSGSPCPSLCRCLTSPPPPVVHIRAEGLGAPLGGGVHVAGSGLTWTRGRFLWG